MTAGNININPQVTGGTSLPGASNMFYTGSFGGTVAFTGGTLTFVNPNANAGAGYTMQTNAAANFAGSTIRFGDGISDLNGSTNGFNIQTVGKILGNVIVNNAPGSVSTTRVVKLAGASAIGGNLTINSGTANQFILNGYPLTIGGNISNSGTFNSDGTTGNGLIFTGTAQQTVGGTGTFSTAINDLTINNTSGASPAVDLQIPLTVSNSLTLTSGILGSSTFSPLTIGKSAASTTFNLTRAGGSLATAPTFALGGVTLNNVTYNTPSPAAAVTTSVELPVATPITLFTVNNTSGLTLDKSVSCTTLALTSGILTATGANTISVTGSLATSITGGSATSYVNGPLTRNLPNNAAAANYKFPVGKTGYRLLEFASITTGGAGLAPFTVEAFDAGPYTGTAGTGLSTINTDKYWSVSASLGLVTITSSTIRLTDAGLVPANRLGQSNSATGTYNTIGGSVSGTTTITSVSPVDYTALSTGTFFRIGSASAFAAGTYAIGPQTSYAGYSGTFATFSAAVAAITAVPLTGNIVFEFKPDYVQTGETFPVSMTSTIASSAAATITFRPATSVSSVINITAAGIVVTNAGADYIFFDGRNGGTGTNKFLQFTNSTTTGSVVTLSGDAQYNQFQFFILKGSTTTASTGLLTVNAPTSGNNFLTVNQCNFDGSSTANYCIYTTGVATDATLTSNNFFDYRNGAGIYLVSGSNNAVIDNNSFYQTTVYNGIAGTTYGINIPSGSNVRISNNNIGGNGPALAGVWTVAATSPAAYNFTGILATLTTTSKVYGNRIQNFDWKSNASTWTGMSVSGSVNVGTDGPNYIGNSTSTGNIKVTYYATGSAVINGIVVGTTAIVENNVIGSITTLLASGVTGTGCTFYGISANSTGLINNNTIGSATTPLSINMAAQSVNSGTQNVEGIYSTGGTVNFTNNTIANLNNGSTVASGITRGIMLPNYASTVTISGNSIYSITTAQPVTGSGYTLASLDGITIQASNANPINVIGNTIYDLVNTTATAAVNVNGIYWNASASTANRIEKNTIRSFKTVSPAAAQNGLNLNYGGVTFQNNVVQLGTDKDGNAITSTAQITGILKATGTACNFYDNTIYVTGSGVTTGAVNTYCLYISTHTTEDVRDNVFMNVRSGGGKNYAARIVGTAPNQSGLTCNYNDLYVNGTGGAIGYYNSLDQTTLAAWRTATGMDMNSLTVDPQFPSLTNLAPDNTALIAGIPIAGITTDFAGVTRNVTTPTIGAYEYQCINPTAGGTIAADQNNCGSFDPALITSSAAPSGYHGTLEYKWQQSITSGTAGFTDIASSNAATYDPGLLTQTTWFKRLSRVTCMADWTGAAASNAVAMMVNHVAGDAGAITGAPTYTPGTSGVAYSVDSIAYATSYIWAYSGTGVTVHGNGRSVTLDFSSGTTPGQLTVKGHTDCGDGASSFLNLQSSNKILTLNSVMLEGLYDGGGLMRPCYDDAGCHWPVGVADHISVELHDASAYSAVVFTAGDVELSVSGSASVTVPGTFGDSYYITIRHRNSIETVSASPVSFAGGTITQSFGSPDNVYGGNLVQMTDLGYAIYTGDVNQDGLDDSSDMMPVENQSTLSASGYLTEDLNGDGLVDSSDMGLLENNSTLTAASILPL